MSDREARILSEAMQRVLAEAPEPDWPFLDSAPPVRVIDCVLSLNRAYTSFLVPRVRAFEQGHPEVRTCADLRDRMLAAPSPAAFLAAALRVNDARRARTLLGVTEYAIDAQGRFAGADESSRLAAWARWARPGDYLSAGVPGFGLAGFQYLRMLFGAVTAKPDVHLIRFVSQVLGRKVSDAQTLYLLERAAQISGLSLRAIDGKIWERGAHG